MIFPDEFERKLGFDQIRDRLRQYCLGPLGIRQVDKEVVEAGHAFGAHPRRILRQIQLPLALPTIMAGINQTIMLALSMVVIASMIGAKGLGGEVWKAIQRLQPDKGFEAGIAIVIIAMILDRVMQGVGRKSRGMVHAE